MASVMVSSSRIRLWILTAGLLLATTVSPTRAQENSNSGQVFAVAAEFRLIHARLGGSESLGETISRPYYLGDTLVQYFGRARLERAGRTSSKPLGTTQVSELGRYLARLTGDSIRRAFLPDQPADDGLFVSETQHRIGGQILDYWRSQGGLERFGQPISEQFRMGSRSVQWFAKAVLEIAIEPSNSEEVREREVGREYLMFSRDERDAIESIPPVDARDLADPADGLDVPIVYIHEIPDDELFERQIVGILDAGFAPIPLARLVRSLTCCATLPKNPIVFTFDDGWDSQVQAALPVLARHRIPATFFVLPGFDVKQANHMTFEDFKTLADAGMSVQSHSLNHAELPRLVRFNRGAAEAEVVESKRILEQIGGVDYFAYPFGAYDPETEDLMARANYAAAMSTRFGRIHFRDDLMHLSRIAVNVSASVSTVIGDLQRASELDERRLGNDSGVG